MTQNFSNLRSQLSDKKRSISQLTVKILNNFSYQKNPIQTCLPRRQPVTRSFKTKTNRQRTEVTGQTFVSRPPLHNRKLDGCCLVTSLNNLAQHRVLLPEKIVGVNESIVASKAMFALPAWCPSMIPAGN